MKEGKLFLIEKGHIVVIRESAEDEISFASLDEFASYIPEKDISRCYDYYYLDYEPDNKVHFYNLRTDLLDADLVKGGVPDKTFDGLIDNFQLIKQRKLDPFWGKSLDDARDFGLQQVRNKTFNSIRDMSSDIDFWRHEVGLKTAEEKVARNDVVRDLILHGDSVESQINIAKTVAEIRGLLK